MNSCFGELTVICGPMFSGKTEELIRRIRRAKYGKKEITIFKHSIDTRYEKKCIVSHAGDKLEAIMIHDPNNFFQFISHKTDLVAIDEIQFFSKDIIEIIMKMRNQGIDVIVAGLDLDFRGVPFGVMPYLLALADEVLKLKAICFKTGKNAQYSQRLINGVPAKHTDPIILVAATDYYEARSKDAFEIDYIPLKEYLEQKKI